MTNRGTFTPVAPGGGISLVELVVLGWASAAAVPAPVPIRIDFEAPADCSTADVFYDGIRARTDRVRRAAEGEGSLSVRVRLTRLAPDKVHGELRVSQDGGETDTRTVDGASCDVVVQALSLTAALALEQVIEETSPPPPAAPPPAVPTPQPPPPPVVPHTAPPFRFELGARVVVAHVVVPYVSLGGALVARLTQRSDALLSPSFGIALLHARNDLFQSPEHASIGWTAAALDACPLRWKIAGFLDAQPCVLGMGGLLAATGQGVSRPQSVVRSWWSAGVSVRASALLGAGVSIELEAGLSTPLARRRFTIGSPPNTVGETATISPLASLGLVHTF